MFTAEDGGESECEEDWRESTGADGSGSEAEREGMCGSEADGICEFESDISAGLEATSDDSLGLVVEA